MSRRIVPTLPPSSKDDNGAYQKAPETTSAPVPSARPPSTPDSDSIDGMLKTGLSAVYRALRVIHGNISTGVVDRVDIQSLKDIISILRDLKQDEASILEGMSDEELREHAQKTSD